MKAWDKKKKEVKRLSELKKTLNLLSQEKETK